MTHALTEAELEALKQCLADPDWPGLKYMEQKRAAWREAAAMSLMTGTIYYVNPMDGNVRQYTTIFYTPYARSTPGYPRPFASILRRKHHLTT